jgi:hypothetical protein
MASKRPKISFPELEPKGRHAILRTPEEVAAEAAMLATQQAGNPASESTPASVAQQDNNRVTTKVSYRVSPEAVDAVDDIKRMLARQYRVKVSRERIAEAAILAAYEDMLENRHASKLVSQLAGKED